MPTVYFPVSKCHLTGNYMKESSNNSCLDCIFIQTPLKSLHLNLHGKEQSELVGG